MLIDWKKKILFRRILPDIYYSVFFTNAQI